MPRDMNNSAFTLVEMLIVIAVAGILAAIAFPMIFKTLQSDTTVKSAAKAMISDLKTAQNEAVKRGGGDMQGGILVEKSVFVVFPTNTNTYQVWAYTDTNGDGVRDAGADAVCAAGNTNESCFVAAATALPSSVRFGASATVTKRACAGTANQTPQASGLSFNTQTTPPCIVGACMEFDGNGFLSGAANAVIYLTNDTYNYAVSINPAGNFSLCKWGGTAWVIIR